MNIPTLLSLTLFLLSTWLSYRALKSQAYVRTTTKHPNKE